MFTIRGGDGITAVVDPEHGARIVSLTAHDREWLSPSRPDGSGPFVHAGTGGWDEAIPTVEACELDGTALPDHGDVWNSVWEAVDTGNSVTTTTDLRSVPVRLRREISATPTGLRLSYTATTTSIDPVAFLWSAHPLFRAEPGSVMRMTEQLLTEEYPSRGRRVRIPAGIDAIAADAALKAFASGLAEASVVHPDGAAVTLSWDPGLLPYLGLYWDRGEFSTGPVMAIEPTMAPTDSAARAESLWTVTATAPKSWWLDVTAADFGRA